MSRWNKYIDGDAGRLPEGLRRIGYDADSESYTFKDRDGSIWKSESGNQYGNLKLVTKAPSKAKKETEPMPPLYSASPTSMAGEKKDKAVGRSKSSRHSVPAPPYTQPSRRFTDFNQLVDKDGKRKDQPDTGFLSQVKRSLSVRNKRVTGSRRGTV